MADYLPENAVDAGADIVIHSLHKTLPSPTQTALLHVNGGRVRIRQIERYFSIFQTTSPSYVLMAGIDECICMLQKSKERFFIDFYEMRKKLHASLERLKHIRIVDAFAPLALPSGKPGGYAPEMGKLLLIPEQEYMTARELHDALRVQYHLQSEMVTTAYVLLILTIMDTEEGYRRLSDALHEIDNNMEKIDNTKKCLRKRSKSELPEAVYTIAEADTMEGEWISSEDAIGRISQGIVAVYPPGRPLLVPGERITEQLIEELKDCRRSGCEIHGIALWGGEPDLFRLLCICDR